MSETITNNLVIKAVLLKDLPDPPNPEEHWGESALNYIYLVYDEPAIYFDNYDGKLNKWHRVRVADFPTDLFKIPSAGYAWETDDILFDTSQGANDEHYRTLKKGKLPTFFSSSNRAMLLEAVFNSILPNKITTVGAWSYNSTYAATNSFTLPVNTPVLISVPFDEYYFAVIPSNSTNIADTDNRWSYFETFLNIDDENASTSYIIVIKHNTPNKSFSADDYANLLAHIKVNVTEENREAIDAEINYRINELAAQIEALKTAPFDFHFATLQSQMNSGLDKIWIYIGTEDGGPDFGHVYFYNDTDQNWVDLGTYIDESTEVESRLQALEDLGLIEKDGQIQVQYSIENQLFPVMKSTSAANLTGITIALETGKNTSNNTYFTMSGIKTGTEIGYRWLRGDGISANGTGWKNVPAGTYLFKLDEDLPQGSEIIVYEWGQITANNLYTKTTEQLLATGKVLALMNKAGTRVTLTKETTNISLLLRIHPGTNVGTNTKVVPQVYLIKSDTNNPLLLDLTGEQMVDAINNLASTEDLYNALTRIMTNPGKYIANVGETALMVMPNVEILTITNMNPNEESVDESIVKVNRLSGKTNEFQLAFTSKAMV